MCEWERRMQSVTKYQPIAVQNGSREAGPKGKTGSVGFVWQTWHPAVPAQSFELDHGRWVNFTPFSM